MKKRYALVNSKGSFKALIEIDEDITIHTVKAFSLRPVENWAYELYTESLLLGFKKEVL